MKFPSSLLSALAAFACVLDSAVAQVNLPFYEPFNYGAEANLAGNGNWVNIATTIKVTGTNMSYPGLQVSAGNDVSLIPGSSAGRTYLNFAAQTSGTVYFSFLFKLNIAPSAQRLVAYAYSTSSSSSTPYLGIFVNANGQLAVGISTSSPQYTSDVLNIGETYLVVVAYTFAASDSAKIWINPVSLGGDELPATGSFTSSTHNSSLAYFQLNTPSAGTGGGSYELDELRVGLVWDAVTPTGSAVAPTIITQPTNRVAGVGSNAVFTVSASGTSPLGYQWYFNGSTILAGATNTTLNLTAVQNTDAGNYQVVITNAVGAITSSVATLTVTNPPASVPSVEKLQSFRASLTNAQAVLLGVTGAVYHLQRSEDMAVWATIKTNTATTNGLLVVEDSFSGSPVILGSVFYRFLRDMNPPVAPFIIAQPQSLTTTSGLTATFFVTATGTVPLRYQWFFNNTAQVGATNFSLTLANVATNQAGNYFVRITNAVGAVTSSVVALNVIAATPSAPSIATPPLSQSVTVGNNVTFTVAANGTAPLSYQWFFNSAAQAGATNASYTLTSVTTNQAGNYFIRITNNVGAVTSSIVTLTVNPAPTGGVYYVATSGSDANSGSFAAPFATLTKAFSVMAAGDTVYVRGGNYTMTAQVKPGFAGTAANYCKLWAYPGERPVLDFSGTASGTKALYLSKDYWHVKGLEIANAMDNGIIVAGASSNIVEGCSVHDCDNDGIRLGSSTATASYTLILNCDSYRNFQVSSGGNNGDGFASKAGTGPGNVFRGCRSWNNSDDGWDFYDNDIPITLENCITYANGVNVWGASGFTGNGNGFKLGGASTHSQHILKNCLAIQNVHDGFDQNYNSGGVTLYNCTAYGNGVNYQFPDTPTVGVDVIKNCISYGGTNYLNAAAQLTSNSWQNFTVTAADFQSLDTATITNARNADYSLPELLLLRLATNSQLIDKGVDVGLPYNGNAPDLGAYESSGATSPVAPAITVQPQGQTTTAGQNVTFSVTATGTAPLRYLWFFNNALQAGATNASLTLLTVTTNQGGNYFVVVTNSSGAVTSAVATLTVNAPIAPGITTQPVSQTVGEGATATFSITATGTAPLSYQWFYNNAVQVGATNASLSLVGVATNQSGNYFVRVTNLAGVVTSSVVTLTVTNSPTAPAISVQPASQSVTVGDNVTFNVTATGSTPLRYQWFFNNAAQASATNASFVLLGVTTNQAGNYSVRITNNYGAVTSSVAVLTVNTGAAGADFYVALDGNDANPGTLAAPFATIPRAITAVSAGQTIYIRGGTHYYSSTIRIEKSGTANAPIKLFAYPGEQPILNFTNQPLNTANRGILITTNGNWWQFKGLEVCYAGDNGIKVEGSHHRFELCVFHHNNDTGLQIGFGHTDSNPGGQLAAYVDVINCDSYRNFDPPGNGGNADGFAAKMHCGQGIFFSGCRAWENGDDAWDLFETDYSVVISNCWCWKSAMVGGQGNGNGFKLGGDGAGGSSMGTHYAIRCVAFACKVNGFTQNSHRDGEVIINCLSFTNGTSGYNYYFEGTMNSGKQNVFKNNVGILRKPTSTGNNFIEDNSPVQANNSWNLSVTSDYADYVSLLESAALAPRQADGSLPTGFARLLSGSDLIDKGVNVGDPYNGSAPDLGPYEYSP